MYEEFARFFFLRSRSLCRTGESHAPWDPLPIRLLDRRVLLRSRHCSDGAPAGVRANREPFLACLSLSIKFISTSYLTVFFCHNKLVNNILCHALLAK